MTIKWLAVPLLIAAASLDSASGSLRRLDDLPLTPPRRPYCYTENGFDYEGNDIKNVASATADKCCSECSLVNGCKAWSWSNYNNGTCWLKSARGKIIVNANIKSASLFNGFQPTCVVAQDVDYVGNDIGHVASASVDGCCDLCHNFLGCRAYSWSNHEGGTCWLKSSKGQAIVKTGVKSAEAYPTLAYEPVCALEYDVDFVDNDIGNAPSASPTGCCAICSKTTNCRAFAWTNQNGGTCWLKKLTGAKIKKAGVISSTIVPNPTPKCTFEPGIDYMGDDIANVPSANPDVCCAQCSQRADCKAFTWSEYNGGTCWLKSGKGSVVRTGKTNSGTPIA